MVSLLVLPQLGLAPEEGGEVVVEDARLLRLGELRRVEAEVLADLHPEVYPGAEVLHSETMLLMLSMLIDHQ